MRNLYLIRHGQADFPGNIRRCIGRTDLPLSEKGRKQGRELGDYFRSMTAAGVPVYASPLRRALDTARLLAGDSPVRTEEGLTELNMGEWENMPMASLNKTLESQPETGERREDGLVRIKRTVRRILAETKGDVICVAHAGINSCLLAELTGTALDRSRTLFQPCGGFSRIETDGKGHMEVKELGIMPKAAPDEEECRDIWDHYGTPDRVRSHCRAVWRQAGLLAERLEAAGHKTNRAVIRSGALLHDVARTESGHAAKGAYILRREGYPAVAEVIRCHHDLEYPDGASLSGELLCPDPERLLEKPLWLEAAVVYLADKQVEEDRTVPMDRRFAESRKRCLQAQDRKAALAAHEKRWRQAKAVEEVIRRLGGIPKE